MITTEYYLKQLDYYRTLLIANLRSLGIECDDNEKFNTLIPKIYGLTNSGGVIVYDYTLYGYSGSQENIEKIIDRVTVTKTLKSLKNKFAFCKNLTYLPLYKLNTSEVTEISGMVAGVNTDLTIDVHGCDLSKVTNTSGVGYDNWNTSSATYPVSNLNLQNAKLSFAAFLALTTHSTKLTTIGGLDAFELVIDKTQPLSIAGFLNEEGYDMDLSYLLNQFEDATLKVSGDTFYMLPNMTYPVILPKCYVELPTSGSFYARYFKKCKHLDFSNAEIVNIDKITNLTFYGNFFAEDLTDEELDGSVYKLYSNFKDINYTTFNIASNKACGDLDLDGLHLAKWDALNYLNSYIKKVDYTTFTLATMPTSSTLVFSDTRNWNTFPKLEIFKYDKGGTLSFSDSYAPGFYFGNVPNLKHFEVRNVTIRYLRNLFYNGQSHHSNTEVDSVLIEDCVFQSTATTFNGINTFKFVNYLSFKNCVFESSNQSSCVIGNGTGKCKNIDCTGVDFGHVSKLSWSTFGFSNKNVINFVFPSNIGKGFTLQTANDITNYSIYIKGMTSLNKESVLDLFNKAYDLNITCGVYDEEGNPGTGVLYTQKIYLDANMLAQLTPEEIAIVTNKGWNIST